MRTSRWSIKVRTPKRGAESITWKHDAYQGERAFLIGTGASLIFENVHDLERLSGEFTMSCNGIFEWGGLPFTPNIYGMIDHPAFPMWRESAEIKDTFRIAALRGDWPTDTPQWTRVLQRRDLPLADGHWGGFEEDFTWVSGRANVMWTLLAQAAFWLGFKDVYLLGVDGWSEDAPQVHCYEVRDFLLGKLQRTPSMINDRTKLSVRKAIPAVKGIYESYGRTITNLNPDSFMKQFPKATLSSVL